MHELSEIEPAVIQSSLEHLQRPDANVCGERANGCGEKANDQIMVPIEVN
jgi:hypothetical protein